MSLKLTRALFCFGVLPPFFEAGDALRKQVAEAITAAYSDLEARFGVNVLATFDDDCVLVGPAGAYPWTAYILAEIPTADAAVALCNVLRETRVGAEDKLWKYMKVEARLGRELFFGRS